MKTYLVTDWDGNVLNREATEENIIFNGDSMGYGDYYLFLDNLKYLNKINDLLKKDINKDIYEIIDDLALKENEDYELLYSGFDNGEYISEDTISEEYKYYFHKYFNGIEFGETKDLYNYCCGQDVYIDERGDTIYYVLCNTEILEDE